MSVAVSGPADTGVAAARRRFGADLVGYGLASAVALGCDCTVLFAATTLGCPYPAAAALGFLAGMAVAYAISVRWVFADRRRRSRGAEVAGFVAIGLVGLALTELLLVALVDGLAAPLPAAKALTVGVVFAFNFLARRSLVFSDQPMAMGS